MADLYCKCEQIDLRFLVNRKSASMYLALMRLNIKGGVFLLFNVCFLQSVAFALVLK